MCVPFEHQMGGIVHPLGAEAVHVRLEVGVVPRKVRRDECDLGRRERLHSELLRLVELEREYLNQERLRPEVASYNMRRSVAL